MMYEHAESTHRIIVGREYYEPYGLLPEAVAEAALGLILTHKLERNSEGLLTISQFPVNYFAITEVAQWAGEEWGEALEAAAGRKLDGDAPGEEAWRFNRTWPSIHNIKAAGEL